MAGQVERLVLSSYSEKMLMDVVTRYGKDSLQYVQAGGKLCKRSTRPISTPTIASVAATSATTNGNGAKATAN